MSESTRCLDAKGLPCPQPVVLAKKALEEGGFEVLEIQVDDESSLENVTRFAIHGGHTVEAVETAGGVSTIRIRVAGAPARAQAGTAAAAEAPAHSAIPRAEARRGGGTATVFISSATIGSGDDELGGLLMKGFILTLLETAPLPERIILMNGGVMLAVEGSASLDKLAALAERGVEILSCGSCLDFYKIKDRLGVGRITNMFEIAEFLVQGSVLSI
jgi:selenium metabolism protein YedF